jgi:hypothetical protein
MQRLVNAQLQHRKTIRKRFRNESVHRDTKRPRVRSKFDLPNDWQQNFDGKCFFCDKFLSSIRAMTGHLRHCTRAKLADVQMLPNTQYINYTNSFEETLMVDAEVTMKYFYMQQNTLQFSTCLKTGYVETLTGKRKKAFWRHYLEVASYVTLHGVQGLAADDLLLLIKKLSDSDSAEIALPARMRTLMEAVTKSFEGFIYKCISIINKRMLFELCVCF